MVSYLISTMLYHFRLVRDSYLEIALLFLYMRKPKSKLSASPLTLLKVTNNFIRNLKYAAFELADFASTVLWK